MTATMPDANVGATERTAKRSTIGVALQYLPRYKRRVPLPLPRRWRRGRPNRAAEVSQDQSIVRVAGRRAKLWPFDYIVQPPETSMTAPLMYDASSEASHA